MKGGHTFESRTEIGYFQNVHEEIRKLVHVFLHLPALVVQHRVLKNLTVIIAHKSCARSGRRNDVTVGIEFLDELFSYLFALIPVARIESRLAAAGLLMVIIYTAAHTLQYLDHI